MADRGIMFSGGMVRALLDGHKSQTRRIVNTDAPRFDWAKASPYAPGDRLWVREEFAQPFRATETSNGCIYRADGPEYLPLGRSLHQWGKEATWTSARHMPKRASRIWLNVIHVRLERLQGITADDCRAEGHRIAREISDDQAVHDDAARDWYSDLWHDLHNKRGERWVDNPWVAVIIFNPRRGNIDVENAAA